MEIIRRLSVIILLYVVAPGIGAQELRWFHAPGWYPLTMRESSTREIYGVSKDIMNELAKILNTNAKFQDVPWKRGFLMLDQGTVDICAGAYESAERQEKYLFTQSIFRNETRIFVMKTKMFTFDRLSDLKGKRLGKSLGSSYGIEFDTFAKDNIIFDEITFGKESMTKMLRANRIDGFLADYVDAMNYLRVNKLDAEIVPLDKVVNSVDVYLLVSKRSQWSNRMGDINRAISLMIDQGRITKILKGY